MMQLLSVAHVPATTLVEWSDAALELFYGWPSAERQAHLAELVADFHRWLTDQVAGAAPADGLIGALRNHRLPCGESLDTATAVAVCFFVFIAGQSTTGQLISTVLRRALAAPQAWARAATEDGFAQAWVEEVLRREPPVTTWRRVAAGDVELSGVQLPEGAQLLLMLMLMGTGSDPEVFEQPEQMCPHRATCATTCSSAPAATAVREQRWHAPKRRWRSEQLPGCCRTRCSPKTPTRRCSDCCPSALHCT
jgi:cytochrome P450